MEIKDIETLIKLCPSDVVEVGSNTDVLKVLENIISLRNYRSRFNFNRYNYERDHEANVVEAYAKLQKETLEGRMADLGITLFTIANKYHLDMRSLHIDAELSKSRDLESLMVTMAKIALSEYNMAKKMIILIGMLLCYCLKENIDILFFIKNRLLMS